MKQPSIIVSNHSLSRIVAKSPKLRSLSAAALLLALVGCGGSGTELPVETAVETVGQLLPESNIGSSNQPSDDDGAQSPIVQITAATGVEIVFESEIQNSSIGGGYIEDQWVQMQTCLNITAVTPKIHVMSGSIAPLSDTDDVLRYIDGSVLATSTVTSSDATIQITEADFDGSLGSKGNYLRSVLGRYLWFSSSLPERDYPYDCANQ